MKKLLLIAGFIWSLVFYGNMAAQTPQVSTASNPIWYYIQVVGSGATIGKVITIAGDNIVGQPLAAGDIKTLNNQLWRFEMQATGYAIINKSTGKRLSVAYDSTTKLRIATVSDNSSTLWRYTKQANNAGYQIRLVDETNLEGTPGEIYLYQTPTTKNFTVIFTGSSNGTGLNATFNFLLNEIPVVSTADEEIWMYIKNAKTGKYLTDAVAFPQGKAYFTLDDLKKDGNETSQQWKLIAKTGNNRTVFINRATRNIINTDAVLDRYYYLQYTTSPDDCNGWNYELISNNQYAVYTTDANGIVKYWHATTPDQPTDSYVKGNAKDSDYAWIFSWASDNIITGNPTPPVLPYNVRAYSFNKRIYVEGCSDYKIVTIYGTPVYQNTNLPTGVYLVMAKGRTTKILVK